MSTGVVTITFPLLRAFSPKKPTNDAYISRQVNEPKVTYISLYGEPRLCEIIDLSITNDKYLVKFYPYKCPRIASSKYLQMDQNIKNSLKSN